MRKLIITAASLAALVVPTAAMAAQPDGAFHFKDDGATANANASSIGKQSSAINQNGQFVSGADNAYGIDQTTTPGSRAALVQSPSATSRTPGREPGLRPGSPLAAHRQARAPAGLTRRALCRQSMMFGGALPPCVGLRGQRKGRRAGPLVLEEAPFS